MIKSLYDQLSQADKDAMRYALEIGTEYYVILENQFIGVNVANPHFEILETKNAWSAGKVVS